MRKIILYQILLLLSLPAAFGMTMDSLPDFSVTDFGSNRVLVNWLNGYKSVKQISVQRSNDSIRNFKTILTVPDPMNVQNGYMDTKAPGGNMFYRLFIMLEGSSFIFTPSKRPRADTNSTAVASSEKPKALPVVIPDSLIKFFPDLNEIPPEQLTEEFVLQRINNSRMNIVSDSAFSTIKTDMKGKPKPVVFVPSYRVFSNKEGYVRIVIKDYDKKKYSVKFYEDDESFLFEVKEVNQPFLVLDKTNFYHAGWFRFELFEDGKLIEKHKFYIAKEF